MAKGQLVCNLAHAALANNRPLVASVCAAIVASEPQNSSVSKYVSALLAKYRGAAEGADVPKSLQGLVLLGSQRNPTPGDAQRFSGDLALDELVLPAEVRSEVTAFLEERAHAQALRDMGFEAPHRILLDGPPGNGKTALASAIAQALELPLFVLDFSSIVSSHLGETGSKLAKVFRGAVECPCVLFVDEMETLLSERAGFGNSTEVGEARRVVSTLLLEIDRLPDTVILIGATNHAEMLDRAVVRRFEHHWSLPAPNAAQVEEFLRAFAKRYPGLPILTEMPGGLFAATGQSFSEIERALKKWCRGYVIAREKAR